MSDPIEHPEHYTNRGIKCRSCGSPIECRDVAEHFGFNLGNLIKYVWRAGSKGDRLEDLNKAQNYLSREVDNEHRERSNHK